MMAARTPGDLEARLAGAGGFVLAFQPDEAAEGEGVEGVFGFALLQAEELGWEADAEFVDFDVEEFGDGEVA